ncbi:MAG TPA: acyltransferase family protein [Phototrophicaceae bacterium]|nr:acyltransferase family protein [Phototrophicaceae bacterium]
MAELALTQVRSQPQATTSNRMLVLDRLRGIAILLMAFQHTTYFAQSDLISESYQGVRPDITTWPHVVLGMITHLATEIFYTLAGVSVAFFENSRRKRGWTEWQITRFFFVRAGILLVLDRVVQLLAYGRTEAPFSVLSAIGICLAILAVLRRLPLWSIATFGILLFIGYQFLVEQFPPLPDSPFYALHVTLFHYHPDSWPLVRDPALGRLPLVLLGYVVGRALKGDFKLTANRLLAAAAGGLTAWLILRVSGGYGNILVYQPEWPFIYFFIMNKQPVSMVYILFYLSWGLVVLAILQRIEVYLQEGLVGRVLMILGQTSLFFYVMHLLVYALIGSVYNTLMQSGILPETLFNGMGLVRCGVQYIIGLLILIPLCAAYRQLRHLHTGSILQYL